MKSLIVLFLLLLFCTAAPVFADEIAGVIKSVAGTAYVIRGGTTIPAEEGMRLQVVDSIRTGADGSAGIILRDDSRLSLGPNTELALIEFGFKPAQGKLEMVLRLLRGIAAFTSGQIGKLAPDKIRFETPAATVGIRGTRFIASVKE